MCILFTDIKDSLKFTSLRPIVDFIKRQKNFYSLAATKVCLLNIDFNF